MPSALVVEWSRRWYIIKVARCSNPIRSRMFSLVNLRFEHVNKWADTTVGVKELFSPIFRQYKQGLNIKHIPSKIINYFVVYLIFCYFLYLIKDNIPIQSAIMKIMLIVIKMLVYHIGTGPSFIFFRELNQQSFSYKNHVSLQVSNELRVIIIIITVHFFKNISITNTIKSKFSHKY